MMSSCVWVLAYSGIVGMSRRPFKNVMYLVWYSGPKSPTLLSNEIIKDNKKIGGWKPPLR